MRAAGDAPVDSMGCERLADPHAPPADQRFQVLVSLMLSSQTKDEVTHAAMARLRAFGCTAGKLAACAPEVLQELIYPVGFYRKKSATLVEAAKTCRDDFSGDIPPDLPGLMRLKGVGPKMAHIVMCAAWAADTGIGVDIHVHRIANRLGWVGPRPPKPEDPASSEQSCAAALPGGAEHDRGTTGGKDMHASAGISWQEHEREAGATALRQPREDAGGRPLWSRPDAVSAARDAAVRPRPPTSSPEATRACLEEWLPRQLWGEVNLLLVGFGQTVCLPRDPVCAECAVRPLCKTGREWEIGIGVEAALAAVRAAEKAAASPSPRRRRSAKLKAVDMSAVPRAVKLFEEATSEADVAPAAAAKRARDQSDAAAGKDAQPKRARATGPDGGSV